MAASKRRATEVPRLRFRTSPSSGHRLAYARFDGAYVSFGHEGPDAQRRFDEHLARWLANGRRSAGAARPTGQLDQDDAYTVEDLVADFLHHARGYYRDPDGQPSGEYSNLRLALNPLLRMFRELPAAEFGPVALRAVRQTMIDTERLCRKEINARVHRIRRAWKWAVAEQLIPGAVLEALRALDSLRMGKTDARESAPVLPVEDPIVLEVTAQLCPTVAAMVWFAYWTGARPGEVCGLRWSMIDRTGKVWVAELDRHKTAWRGRRRILTIGPRAQEAIVPLLRPGPDRNVFSPRQAIAEQRAAMATARSSKLTPSHRKRAKRVQRRAMQQHAEHYTVAAFRRAIARGVRAANAARLRTHLIECARTAHDCSLPDTIADRIARLPITAVTDAAGRTRLRTSAIARAFTRSVDLEAAIASCAELPLIEGFAPNRLRHSAATRLRREEGLEAARVVLGHARAAVTEVYAEIDHERSREIAERLG